MQTTLDAPDTHGCIRCILLVPVWPWRHVLAIPVCCVEVTTPEVWIIFHYNAVQNPNFQMNLTSPKRRIMERYLTL